MPAEISVIIPTLNVGENISVLLSQLVGGVLSGLVKEVILADGGSTDDIQTIAEETGAQLVKSLPGRGVQLATGAQAARGKWLLFLHADSVLCENWVEEVKYKIHSDRTACFQLKFDKNHLAARSFALWANIRTKLFGLPYGDQGLLISRETYDKIGGYKPLPLMEDVDIVRRIPKLVILNATITTSSLRYEREGWFYRGAKNILCLVLFYWGIPIERIATLYYSRKS
jgi:rSAM/selenodomain-associated transferase 2